MFGKQIMVLRNEKKFITHKFGEEKVEKSSILNWYALNYGSRPEYVETISRTVFENNDSVWNLGRMTLDADDGFSTLKSQNRELPYRHRF